MPNHIHGIIVIHESNVETTRRNYGLLSKIG